MMAKKAKPTKTDAEEWLEKIERAKKARQKWREQFRIRLCYQYFEGTQRPSNIPESEWITINMIYSMLQADLPVLYSTDPYFYVSLKKSYTPNPMDIPLFEQRGKVRQAMLNYLKGEIGLKKKARLSIFDAYFQYGIAKVHLYAELMENPDYGKPIIDEDTEIAMLGDDGNAIMQPEYVPTNKTYCLTRIHPDDFLVDEDAGPIGDDTSWRAHRIKRPLDEVKEDKKYEKKGRDTVQATETKDESDKEREQRKTGGLLTPDNSKTPDIVTLWEVWDRKNKKWLTVSEGCKEFLIEPEDFPPGIEDDPFVDIRFTLRDDSWYPLPPISQLLDSQREYCMNRSKRQTHRKRFNRKYSMYDAAYNNPEEAASKLENGDDGTVILQQQPGQSVFPIQDAPLDQSEMIELGYLRQDFADLSGAGPNQRGSTQGVGSATESGILEKRAQIREGDKRGLVKDFLVEIARKLDQLIQANITQDQAVKVTGPQGEFWELIRQTDYEEIAGEYEYNLDVGSQLSQMPEVARAQYIQWIGALQSFPQLLLSKSLLKKSAEMFEINDELLVDELFQIGQKMMSGQIPSPGNSGSAPGSGSSSPMAGVGGTAMGINNFRGGPQ